jgi:hypothetical protein
MALGLVVVAAAAVETAAGSAAAVMGAAAAAAATVGLGGAAGRGRVLPRRTHSTLRWM